MNEKNASVRGRRGRKLTVLLVEDDPGDVRLIKALLADVYMPVITATGEEALDYLLRNRVDAVLLDIALGSGISGIDVLKDVKRDYPYLPAIMVTEHKDTEKIKTSMKLGADDYVLKDEITDQEKGLLASLKRVLESRRQRTGDGPVSVKIEGKRDPLIAADPSMLSVLDQVDPIAETDCNVLIAGESGTGKELVARLIHQRSSRSESPFVAMNCAALPELLVESELFGHVRGAFTGAERDRTGKFLYASSGTLFLDEIGDMTLGTQAKVLRVLEDREFERLGDNGVQKTQARFVTASNRDLTKLMANGKFREDLYYRLKVAVINVPPLRMRPLDIEPLTRYFVSSISRNHGREIEGVEPRVLEAFHGMRWPGNVRELRNVIEAALIRAPGPILEMCDVFAPEVMGYHRGMSLDDAKRCAAGLIEEALVRQVLWETCGHVTEASEVLKTSRQNLHNLIKRYNLSVEKFRER